MLFEFDDMHFVSASDLRKVLSKDNFTNNEKWIFATLNRMQNQCNCEFNDYMSYTRTTIKGVYADDTTFNQNLNSMSNCFTNLYRDYLAYLNFLSIHEEEISHIYKKLRSMK